MAQSELGKGARGIPALAPPPLTNPTSSVVFGLKPRWRILPWVADTDEAGHAFQSEAGHLFRPEAGRRSDLMSATGGLLPQIEVDDVSVVWIGQDRIDFTATNAAFANFRRRD